LEAGDHQAIDIRCSARARRRIAVTRNLISFSTADVSGFARALARQLAQSADKPGHTELLNMIARASGRSNFQALRAAAKSSPALIERAPKKLQSPENGLPLPDNARKALGQFDDAGRVVRWPVKFSVQRLILWPLWAQFAARRKYTEREVNQVLKAFNTFGDHVTLRRELINEGMLKRKPDCSEYWKVQVRPSAEAALVIREWKARVRQH
jgi:hypothetical protein